MGVDIEKAIKVMGKEPINPIGACFDSAAAHFVEWTREGAVNLHLVHGIGIANLPGQEGNIMAHAWIEFGDWNERLAYDTTRGIKMLAKEYRKQIQCSYAVEYNFKAVKNLWNEWGSNLLTGPWDKNIREISMKADEKKL